MWRVLSLKDRGEGSIRILKGTIMVNLSQLKRQKVLAFLETLRDKGDALLQKLF